MKTLRKLFHDWLTGPCNDNFELWRAMSLVAFLVGMGLQIYVVAARGVAFDLQEFGIGTGILLATLSGATALKDNGSARAKKEAA